MKFLLALVVSAEMVVMVVWEVSEEKEALVVKKTEASLFMPLLVELVEMAVSVETVAEEAAVPAEIATQYLWSMQHLILRGRARTYWMPAYQDWVVEVVLAPIKILMEPMVSMATIASKIFNRIHLMQR